MVIEEHKNIPLEGKHQRPVVTDVYFTKEGGKKPVVIFCHGYKGFKDWGVWDLMAREFARRGFFFLKFNFSYNGGTLEQPIDFPDLEAFGQNTFIKELDDLEVVLDWVNSPETEFASFIDSADISLVGHSRGGGTVIIKAAEDSRVTKLVTLASVSDFAARFPKGKEFEAWKKAGIGYVKNARTKQEMPHLFSFYENFKDNEERLTISRAVKNLKIPFLIIHGTEDPTVNFDNAAHLKEWNPASQLLLLDGSNHVFEGSHPWEEEEMPSTFKRIVEEISQFMNKDQA